MVTPKIDELSSLDTPFIVGEPKQNTTTRSEFHQPMGVARQEEIKLEVGSKYMKYRKEYYQTHKEQMKEYAKKYYEAHKENYQKYRDDRREAHGAQIRRWKQANKEKMHAYAKIRTERQNRVALGFSIQEWETKLSATKGICPGCGRFVGIEKLTLDHIVPISKAPPGTIYHIEDVRPLCASCNSHKGTGGSEW